ncbi:hypothetical protein MNBD_NITROSPINAE02-38 [hydrothermal vent metagenome]|uniref:Uncharacterized protein n=1 Tax=hydrothermal vent metagenome TaxID=652676 RepID=A0A3B1C0J2_9ZZZZ
MKSAIELAIEKANEMSGGKSKSLTGEQKKKIGEIRQIAEAKIAETRIMLDDKISRLGGNFEAVEQAKAEFRIDKSKIEKDTERKVTKIREGVS